METNEQQNVFFIEKLPSVNARDPEFRVKCIRSSREDHSKNQKTRLEQVFITQKDFQRRTNKKLFFLVEKSTGINVQHQRFSREMHMGMQRDFL